MVKKTAHRKTDDNCLLVGVTGGIATGKTTVAKMLEELGAPVIDYDVLSRRAVEPGNPAYEDIAAFFGKAVFKEDRTLDREKLRQIVFNDPEKRKKLESFIHPRLNALFKDQIDKITRKNPEAIIQVVIPLLIETGMEPMFDLLLMVYAPEAVQLERVMKRDKSSEELAMRIIRSQMPVDEKREHCDLVVDNSGDLENTRRQVSDIWRRLKAMQSDRADK